jgi:hypothetical protein
VNGFALALVIGGTLVAVLLFGGGGLLAVLLGLAVGAVWEGASRLLKAPCACNAPPVTP